MNQPLSYVHPGAKVAKTVVLEPFSTIDNNVEIGEGTWIGSNVTILEGARIGKNCSIFPGAVISGVPQDLKFNGEETTAEIGDNTVIRECVTINRGTSDRNKTVIGKNCLIAANCQIIDSNGHAISIHERKKDQGKSNPVIIGENVWLGTGCIILPGVKIGNNSIIAAGSVVNCDVPENSIFGGNPAKFIRHIQ